MAQGMGAWQFGVAAQRLRRVQQGVDQDQDTGQEEWKGLPPPFKIDDFDDVARHLCQGLRPVPQHDRHEKDDDRVGEVT